MSHPEFEDRRRSFGAAASEYAEHRPGYPEAAIDWILAGADREVRDVADVGAGAGALTELLAARGLRVTAYDPDPLMLAELGRRVAGVPTRVATAESLPLADASVDAVLVAQAWHWFDRPAAGREFERVVRPGGVIGLLWNVRDTRVSWMAALQDVIGGEDTLRTSRTGAMAEVARVHPGVTRRDVAHSVAMTPDALVGLVSTYSYVRLREDADQVYAAVRRLLASHPDTAGRDVVDVPYVCAAYRVLRP